MLRSRQLIKQEERKTKSPSVELQARGSFVALPQAAPGKGGPAMKQFLE